MRGEFPYIIKARCARAVGGRRCSSTIATHAPPRRINGRSGRTPPPPQSDLRDGKEQQQLDPKHPRFRGQNAPRSTRLPRGVGRIQPRAAPSAAAPVGRRRPASMSLPPAHVAARPSPHAAAKVQHGHGGEGDPQQCRSKQLCVTERRRIVMAVARGPTRPDTRAFKRRDDPAPTCRPDGGRGHVRERNPLGLGRSALRL